MAFIARLNAFLDSILRPLCESIARQSATATEVRGQTSVYLLMAKLALIAIVLNVPGYILMETFGHQWLFVAWFLVNMFAWAGPLIGVIVQGTRAANDSDEPT